MDSLRPSPAPTLTFEQFVRGRLWVSDMTEHGGTSLSGWLYPGPVYAEYVGTPEPGHGGRWYAPMFSDAAQSDDLWNIEAALFAFAAGEGYVDRVSDDEGEYT